MLTPAAPIIPNASAGAGRSRCVARLVPSRSRETVGPGEAVDTSIVARTAPGECSVRTRTRDTPLFPAIRKPKAPTAQAQVVFDRVDPVNPPPPNVVVGAYP